MKIRILILSIAQLFVPSAFADDRSDILDVIERLTSGVDTQDGALLTQAFHGDAAIFATNPAGNDTISLSAATFAKVHADKQFGGVSRTVSVSDIDITDGLIANAKVIAKNSDLHYTYYLGFVKLDDEWRIQSFLQRARPAAKE